MTCVAVTRGGLGDIWLFDSVQQADEHAIVQYGDALCDGPELVGRTWLPRELADMAERLGEERLASDIRSRLGSHHGRTDMIAEYLQDLWNMLVSRASRPPSDPADVLRTVAEDRRATRTSGVRSRPHPNEQETGMAEAAETTRPAVRTKKYDDNSVITFGKDKEGVSYGPDNNPKREGSAAHERFKLYKSGQTVAQALDAGVTRGDINWDAKKGFIQIK